MTGRFVKTKIKTHAKIKIDQVLYYHRHTLKTHKHEDCATANTLMKADHGTPKTSELKVELSCAILEEEDQKMSADDPKPHESMIRLTDAKSDEMVDDKMKKKKKH